jgi:hypothetical protein
VADGGKMKSWGDWGGLISPELDHNNQGCKVDSIIATTAKLRITLLPAVEKRLKERCSHLDDVKRSNTLSYTQ